MKIKSSAKPLPIQPKIQVTESDSAKAKPESNYFETFQAQAKTEVPRAVVYSAIAGASLGVAAVAFGFTPALAGAAQTVGLSAAAGAGIGLFSGLAGSALKAAAQSVVPPETGKVDPVPVPPEQLLLKDMNQAEQILDRRVSGLKSLMKAEQARFDTVGRSGMGAYDGAKGLLDVAAQDLAKLNQQRAEVVSLEQEKESLDQRLGKLRAQQQETLNVQLQADQLVNKSIGRTGTLTQRESKLVAQELQREVDRVLQASSPAEQSAAS